MSGIVTREAIEERELREQARIEEERRQMLEAAPKFGTVEIVTSPNNLLVTSPGQADIGPKLAEAARQVERELRVGMHADAPRVALAGNLNRSALRGGVHPMRLRRGEDGRLFGPNRRKLRQVLHAPAEDLHQ